MKKRNETIRMLVLSAMFAALCCVTTMLVQFPTVAGYTNIGEGMCLLAGLVLGPWYGFFAAGIGSGLADLLAGYAHYVPGTFIIKGLVALVAALLLRPPPVRAAAGCVPEIARPRNSAPWRRGSAAFPPP